MRFGRICKCGHTKENHLSWNRLIKGSTDEIGACLYDSTVIGPWRYSGCTCLKYTPKNWPLIHFIKDEQ